MPVHAVVDQRQVGRLKAIIETYAARKTLFSRGLASGKVDKKRLYRGPITGRCFVDKQKLPDVNWNICLLVDASRSMARRQNWRFVESAVATLHKAFRGSNNRLQVWAYLENQGICIITSLLKGEKLMSITPMGETASGQAIIGAAYLMPLDGRRRLLIHITDGVSNCGCGVEYGINYCKQQHIHLFTLGCGFEDRQAIEEQYGKSVQFLDYFGQLPGAVEKLLKWAFLYGVGEKPGTTKGIGKA